MESEDVVYGDPDHEDRDHEPSRSIICVLPELEIRS